MVKKIKILADPPEGQGDTAHLQPILDYLSTKGNSHAAHRPFLSTPNGFVCTMRKEIDWDDLEAQFELPSSLVISREYGVLRDEGHCIEIVSGAENEQS